MVSINSANAFVFSLSQGAAFYKLGKTQTLLLQTSPQSLGNKYVADKSERNSYMAQLFLGQDVYKQKYLKLQLGITLGDVDDIRMKGIVDQFALPEFDNLDYSYDVRSLSAMAAFKVLLFVNNPWQPYLEAGFGFSHNRASDYHETPRIFGAVPMAPFRSNSITNTAYQLGGGLGYHFSKVFSVGLGYQYSNLGQARLGTASDQQTTATLNEKPIVVQAILFNFTWNV